MENNVIVYNSHTKQFGVFVSFALKNNEGVRVDQCGVWGREETVFLNTLQKIRLYAYDNPHSSWFRPTKECVEYVFKNYEFKYTGVESGHGWKADGSHTISIDGYATTLATVNTYGFTDEKSKANQKLMAGSVKMVQELVQSNNELIELLDMVDPDSEASLKIRGRIKKQDDLILRLL